MKRAKILDNRDNIKDNDMYRHRRKIFLFLKGREKDMEEAKLAPKNFIEEFRK